MTTIERDECMTVLGGLPEPHRTNINSYFPIRRWEKLSNYQKAWLLLYVRTGKPPKTQPTSNKNVSTLHLPGLNITPTYQTREDCIKYMQQTESIHYHDVSQVH